MSMPRQGNHSSKNGEILGAAACTKGSVTKSDNWGICVSNRLVSEHGIEAIPAMCIHMAKIDEEGRPKQVKSRAVVMGNEEDHHWSKNDLFMPVIVKHTVCALVTLAVSEGR